MRGVGFLQSEFITSTSEWSRLPPAIVKAFVIILWNPWGFLEFPISWSLVLRPGLHYALPPGKRVGQRLEGKLSSHGHQCHSETVLPFSCQQPVCWWWGNFSRSPLQSSVAELWSVAFRPAFLIKLLIIMPLSRHTQAGLLEMSRWHFAVCLFFTMGENIGWHFLKLYKQEADCVGPWLSPPVWLIASKGITHDTLPISTNIRVISDQNVSSVALCYWPAQLDKGRKWHIMPHEIHMQKC